MHLSHSRHLLELGNIMMPGEFRALPVPLLRLATAAMQSDAVSHVSDPQRTVGHVWGGDPVVDQH